MLKAVGLFEFTTLGAFGPRVFSFWAVSPDAGGSMSVWPSGIKQNSSLKGSEGALISVSVNVEPRLLEDLLEALARLQFPINPQIYHDAAVRYFYADGRDEMQRTTLVEFPAYADRLPEIRQLVEASGFSPDSLHVTSMLEEINADPGPEPAPEGAPYLSRVLMKHVHAVAAH